jgi:hypothetical protein
MFKVTECHSGWNLEKPSCIYLRVSRKFLSRERYFTVTKDEKMARYQIKFHIQSHLNLSVFL